MTFIHLRVHSAYSILEGALPVKDLAARARALEMPAIAITDTNNLYGALEFAEAAKAKGVQPIIGCQLDLAWRAAEPRQPLRPAPIVLLAQSEAGYLNLMALSSKLFLREGEVPHVTLAELEAASDGLICLGGGAAGPLAQDPGVADRLARAFPDRLYVEIQRHPDAGQTRTAGELAAEPGLVQLAYDKGLPLVATNDVHFPAADLHEAHDALICIADGTYVDQAEARRTFTPHHHLKPASEMAALFADLPEAVENTVEIARRCAYAPTKRAPILPTFAPDEVEELRRQARAGLDARLAVIEPAAPREVYHRRLAFELEIIEDKGFPGYFLIVADFIKWAKAQGIPVGPGRGSGAGSLVAYALTITNLDPLRYSLLFERFLNPERKSMPDFDIDFCMDRREEVIAYVQDKYGRDRVAQIITFGALLSKAAVRDVGRVLQMPYGQVDRLSKMIPIEGVKPVSVAKALAEEPRLKEEAAKEEVVARLLDIAGKIEGLYRNASTHAAGVVIGDRPLEQLVALYRDPRSDMPATQFNMKWVEEAGLVKFDFLGLKTLTVIEEALRLLRLRGIEVDIDRIPLDDPNTYAIYGRAETVAVFQVESAGMRDALRRMKPTCLEDIVALVALYRPGPMENIPKFCDVKNGRAERDTLHPLIDHILDETQGIIVYQEQVMQIAQEMAGYSLGAADKLRRAMGKKIQAAMDAEKPKFLEGAAENGVDEAKAIEVWNLLDKFANYGFNKSHAAAYALVSYQTAWLKATHPVEFMAAVMNCDLQLTDKLAVYKREVDRLGIEIVPPCVNRSGATFRVAEGRILYGLGALKNVGPEAMRLIEAAQPFEDLFDLARRVDLRKIGKRPLEMLVRAGAFDALDRNRRRVLQGLDTLLAYSAASADEAASSQVSLFGDAAALPAPRMPTVKDWDPMDRLGEEHLAVGFYLSGHPLDDWQGPLKRAGVEPYGTLAGRLAAGPAILKVAGAVAARQERKSARGNRFAFVRLSDPSAMYEVTVFSETLEATRAHLEPGMAVVLTVEASLEAGETKLLARDAQPLEQAVAKVPPAGLRIVLEDAAALPPLQAALAEAGRAKGARGPMRIALTAPDLAAEVELSLPGDWPVGPAARGALKLVEGVAQVEEY